MALAYSHVSGKVGVFPSPLHWFDSNSASTSSSILSASNLIGAIDFVFAKAKRQGGTIKISHWSEVTVVHFPAEDVPEQPQLWEIPAWQQESPRMAAPRMAAPRMAAPKIQPSLSFA